MQLPNAFIPLKAKNIITNTQEIKLRIWPGKTMNMIINIVIYNVLLVMMLVSSILILFAIVNEYLTWNRIRVKTKSNK